MINKVKEYLDIMLYVVEIAAISLIARYVYIISN